MLQENTKRCASRWPLPCGGGWPRRPRRRLPVANWASKYLWCEKETRGAGETAPDAAETRQRPPHRAGPRRPSRPRPPQRGEATVGPVPGPPPPGGWGRSALGCETSPTRCGDPRPGESRRRGLDVGYEGVRQRPSRGGTAAGV